MSDGLPAPVLIVGSGLLGTSLGLALRRHGVEVLLSDRVPEHVRTASGLGAGHPFAGEVVGLVVVAVPPDHVGHPVRELTRTAIGPVTLGRLGTGELRDLTNDELGALLDAAQL